MPFQITEKGFSDRKCKYLRCQLQRAVSIFLGSEPLLAIFALRSSLQLRWNAALFRAPIEMPATTNGAFRSAAKKAWITPAPKGAPFSPAVKQTASAPSVELATFV